MSIVKIKDLTFKTFIPEDEIQKNVKQVADKINQLKETPPDRNQMQFIHRIDNVLFLHGGLSHAFVKVSFSVCIIVFLLFIIC